MTTQKKILLADDDRTFTTMLKKYLEGHGFDVVVAEDGEEALKKLETSLPHLVLLDVQMPKMNGYSFLFEMRKLEGDLRIPVIVMTCKEELEDIFRVEGIKEYLLKPLKNEVILEKVQKHIL